jgi:Ni/Co efflux regulator RcnB
MTTALSMMFRRIGLVTGAGLIALSASTFVSPVAIAAAPGTNAGQVPPDQPPYTKDQKKSSNSGGNQNGQTQNGQPIYQNNGKPQNGQAQNGQPQNGQPIYQNNGKPQNGQPQNGQAQNGKPIYQNNGQPQNGQAQNGQTQNGQTQNGQSNGQQWGQQNGQSHTQNPHYDWTAYQPGHQPAQWQQHQQDFNPRAYEINGDSRNRYHWQHYVQPRGWYYQRWVYGQTLPTAFWGREYWLNGYSQFGLINPPYGYVWVRYGDDAMLVAVISGLILSVQYNVFYS